MVLWVKFLNRKVSYLLHGVYISHSTEILKWRTEFQGDLERQGIALSRFAQILAMLCVCILKTSCPLVEYLDKTKFEPVRLEAQRILPALRGLVATEAQKKKRPRGSRGEESMYSMMGDGPATGLPRDDVAKDARTI